MAEKQSGKAGSSEESLNARRKALGEKLARQKTHELPHAPSAGELGKLDYNRSAVAMGFRLSADFLSAILVGGALGLGLDWLTGFSPWGLVVFLFLGFAAGVVNILRSLGRKPY